MVMKRAEMAVMLPTAGNKVLTKPVVMCRLLELHNRCRYLQPQPHQAGRPLLLPYQSSHLPVRCSDGCWTCRGTTP